MQIRTIMTLLDKRTTMNAFGRRPYPGVGRDRGFSVLELLVTVGIIGTLVGASVLIANQVLPTVRADSAMQLLQAQLLQTRQQAMDQRRYFTVTFIGTNEFKIVRQEIGSPTPPPTLIGDYFLPYGATFQVLPGMPDTPDGFGNTPAVTFAQTKIIFVSDGTVQDGNGAVNNGSIFMAIGTNTMTSRAVTVMGATARIRAYRYSGNWWN